MHALTAPLRSFIGTPASSSAALANRELPQRQVHYYGIALCFLLNRSLPAKRATLDWLRGDLNPRRPNS